MNNTFIFQVSFVVKAVSALTAAFRLVQLDSCGQVNWKNILLNKYFEKYFRVLKQVV